MNVKKYIGPIVFGVALVVSVAQFAYLSGERSGRAERKSECYCGTTQTCPFGPGIVGEQSCRTSLDKNEWSRCEPKEERK